MLKVSTIDDNFMYNKPTFYDVKIHLLTDRVILDTDIMY